MIRTSRSYYIFANIPLKYNENVQRDKYVIHVFIINKIAFNNSLTRKYFYCIFTWNFMFKNLKKIFKPMNNLYAYFVTLFCCCTHIKRLMKYQKKNIGNYKFL